MLRSTPSIVIVMEFIASRRKIIRAEEHIAELKSCLARYARNLGSPRAETDAKSGELLLHFLPEPDVSVTLALILGDAVHNLRTALDLAWYEISERFDLPLNKAKFPFRETREELESAIKGAPEIIQTLRLDKFLLDEIQPYSGGNNSLWALHRLDIEDKHRLIIPVLDSGSIRGLRIENDSGGAQEVFIARTGGREMWKRYPAGYKLKSKGEASVNVFFSHTAPILQNEPIEPVLARFSKSVSDVIDGLSACNW